MSRVYEPLNPNCFSVGLVHTFDDAYFDSCIKRNENRIKYGKVMVKRQVVRRKVVIGEWSVCDPSKFRISR